MKKIMRGLCGGWAWVAGLGLAAVVGQAAPVERPSIWVRDADRAAILRKIETQPWAAQVFAAMESRSADWLARHQADREKFLRGLPLVYDPANPAAAPMLRRIGGNMASLPEGERRHQLQTYVNAAVDCGVLYYLTGREAYAACAADVLHTVVQALNRMPPEESPENGGWIYPTDHLYEARALGAQIPLIYDFVAPYVRQGGQVYDLNSHRLEPFALAAAQQVFRTYARLAIEHGIIDANWPVLELPSLMHNILALDDPAERARLLLFVTERDTKHQDSLRKVLAEFSRAGGIWPESFQYSAGVSHLVTYAVALLRRQDPALALPPGYVQLPLSLARLHDFRFPNGQSVRFGDGPRRSGLDFSAFEIAYALGRKEADRAIGQAMGGAIKRALQSGAYDRAQPDAPSLGANVYLGALQLLWYADTIDEPAAAAAALPVTDALPFAGLVLQRNQPADVPASSALMATVAGAAHVHSHASGMALELYGAGHVLGSAAGKGTYTTDEHENYRRLFASYNSVIVNGASASGGGWVNLGIDPVRTVALEPALRAAPVSPHHSFTLTAFTDRQVGGGTASQQRLVGIVLTSPTTGFYVDVARSKTTTGPAAGQFHDYLYHNVADGIILAAGGAPVALTPAPERFQPAAGTTWKRNRSYLFPGWHVFQQARVSRPLVEEVVARFPAEKISPPGVEMRAFFAGFPEREFATALAPVTKDAPAPYDKALTPVLAVRQYGEAWDRPFAVVFEPRTGGQKDGVVAVRPLRIDGRFVGFDVESNVAGHSRHTLVLIPSDARQELRDDARGLRFTGRYAVVTADAAGRALELYVGEGTELVYRGAVLRSRSAAPFSGWVDAARGESRWAKPGSADYTPASSP